MAEQLAKQQIWFIFFFLVLMAETNLYGRVDDAYNYTFYDIFNLKKPKYTWLTYIYQTYT